MRAQFFAMCLLTLSPIATKAQWQWRYYEPSGNNLSVVRNLGGNVWIAAGERGAIVRSSGNADNWQLVRAGSSPSINDLCFVSSSHGWAVADSGTLLETHDGGSSWDGRVIDPSENYEAIYFLDSDNGWIGGTKNVARTTDGGGHWSESPIPLLASGDSSFLPIDAHDVIFRDRSNGWLVGHGVLSTTDGGANWEQDTLFTASVWYSYHISFSDPHHGWIASYNSIPLLSPFPSNPGRVYRTTNGGSTWEKIVEKNPWDPGQVLFLDSLHGYLNGSQDIELTRDGGLTWETRARPYGLNFLGAADSTRLCEVGDAGLIVTSTDNGMSWQQRNQGKPTFFKDIIWVSNSTGYATGSLTILKSTDGGTTFTDLGFPLAQGQDLWGRTFFIDSLRGWACTEQGGGIGSIFFTNDGGDSWKNQTGLVPYLMADICFTDVLHGYAAGLGQYVRQTSDGGQTWILGHVGGNGWYTSVRFLDKNTGWLAGTSIFKTTDAGNSWNEQLVAGVPDFALEDICIVDRNDVWGVGQNLLIVRTTDGGNSWKADTLPGLKAGQDYANGVNFISETEGWVSGSFGLLHTTNAGVTWSGDPLPAQRVINEMRVKPDGEQWAAGSNALFCNPDRVVVSVAPDNRMHAPERLDLQQNYPNPFNPGTTIRYSLPGKSFVLLVIYNTLGQRVATVVNGVQEAGYHDVRFDGRNLASGVYFYRLQAGDAVQTKRLLLLR